MLLRFPPRSMNDNEPREVWTCRACDNASFILQYENGATTIKCAMCNEDVTQAILTTIPMLRGA